MAARLVDVLHHVLGRMADGVGLQPEAEDAFGRGVMLLAPSPCQNRVGIIPQNADG